MQPLRAVDRSAIVTRTQHHPLPLFTLTLRIEGAYPRFEPGEFVMVLPPTTLEPYLRRAFSIFSITRDDDGVSLEIHGKVIGPGTKALARCREGDRVAVLGPLGRGFSRPATGHSVLVAGGVGSAALLLLAEALADEGLSFDFIYGGRSRVDLAHGERFARLAEGSGGTYFPMTEDGSEGQRGWVTLPLARLLERRETSPIEQIYTCGPDPMMAAVARLVEDHAVPTQAALETPMGCGYGACLGCVVPQPDGALALCCRTGPVFDTRHVAW